MITIVIASITLTVAAIAVYTDVRWGKIFNVVTLPALILGLILNSIAHGGPGLRLSLEGLALALALFVLSCLFGRILGGGDIKLLMAIGALQGPVFLLWTLFYGAIVGAILALAISVHKRILLQKLKSLLASCYLRFTCQVPMEMEADPSGPRLPYAIALGFGTLAAMAILNSFPG